MALAASFAMLSACTASLNDLGRVEDPARAADPVIERVTETVRVCPAELRQERPDRPRPADGAELQGNASGMAWLEALLAWAGLIELRLNDAAKECM